MQEPFFDFWCKPKDAENEDAMEVSHRPGWQAFIDALPADLSGKRVLDFGCNQGGFLRLLYSQKPFYQGVGVDLAGKAIQIAESRKEDLPLQYYNTGRPDNLNQLFDVCVSTSVLYFINDFAEHARIIYNTLTENGVYYASYADVNGSHLLPIWHKYLLRNNASVPFHVQSLDDIASGFMAQGFAVAVQRVIPRDFIALQIGHADTVSYNHVQSVIDLAYERSYIFRFSKQASQQV